MYIRIICLTLLLASMEAKGKELDPGPQAIKESTEAKTTSSAASATKSQKRYATKEVILYLTPSQIRALESGKGLISAQSIPQHEINQQQVNPLENKEHEAFVKQQLENIKSAKIAPVEEPQYENFESLSQNPSYGKELSSEQLQKNLEFYERWNQEREKAEEQAKLQYLYSQQLNNNEQKEQWQVPKEENSEAELNAWLSRGSVSEKKQALLNEQLKQEWTPILESNLAQLKALATFTPEIGASTQTEKPFLQSQYGPIYNDQKKAIEIENILRQNHRQELEKQSSLAQAEAIANAPPILVHQEIKITKHRPVPIVKHVKVSVPTPVLVPVPEPYEVKVPHPYPVPLEIIKPIPVPILRTQKVEVVKPIPYAVEKHVPVPVTRNIFVNVDRPYVVEKLVPVEIKKEVPVEIPIHKAEKVTILRHVWKH